MSFLVARIGKPHSLHGEVTVQTHTDDPEKRFVVGASFATELPAAARGPESLTLRSVRFHNGIWLLGFDGVTDRSGAEALRGIKLTTAEDDEIDDEDDGWYEEELVGLKAVSPTGEEIGEVTGLDVGVAQDRLVLRLTDGVEAMVPFVESIVPSVDVEGKVVVVDAPPGLFDLARES